MLKFSSKKNLKKDKDGIHIAYGSVAALTGAPERVSRATQHKSLLPDLPTAGIGATPSSPKGPLTLPSGPNAIEKTMILDLSRRDLVELPEGVLYSLPPPTHTHPHPHHTNCCYLCFSCFGILVSVFMLALGYFLIAFVLLWSFLVLTCCSLGRLAM